MAPAHQWHIAVWLFRLAVKVNRKYRLIAVQSMAWTTEALEDTQPPRLNTVAIRMGLKPVENPPTPLAHSAPHIIEIRPLHYAVARITLRGQEFSEFPKLQPIYGPAVKN